MAQLNLEERVARLEEQVARLVANSSKPGPDDWRKTVGMFTDDEGMLQLFKDALALREKDRARARRQAARRRGTRQ